jgi:ABC-type transport system involved in cytochrome c biogenesis permease subunit
LKFELRQSPGVESIESDPILQYWVAFDRSTAGAFALLKFQVLDRARYNKYSVVVMLFYLFALCLLPIHLYCEDISVTNLLKSKDFQLTPASYQGRFRPAKAAADLWHKDFPSPDIGAAPSPELNYKNSMQTMQKEQLSPKAISQALETRYPLRERLRETSQGTLYLIPGKYLPGEWYGLSSLKIQVYDSEQNSLRPIGNFTLYSTERFRKIQSLYLELENAHHLQSQDQHALAEQLGTELLEGYAQLAGATYAEAYGKALHYPSIQQLKAELFLISTPLVAACLALYALALCFLFVTPSLGTLFFAGAFFLHTAVLGLRCYVLQRPPVSNMLETMIYVPWFTSFAGLLLYAKTRNSLPILASSVTALTILTLLQTTQTHSGLENLQAVLDSQYWLIIHVLLVVGSYGAFILSAVMGHIYLLSWCIYKTETPAMESWIRLVKQTMYIGLSLLIPGTILGGVWAAESWGRFWDWDPKESWAFISICVYLIWVHAYRFHAITNFGLAVGSVAGLAAISFTWYGVNYILGAGLHSYGFGNGGELYYYLFLLAEGLFLGFVIRKKNAQNPIFPV